jgi:hemerythrin-like metal-binding protein
MARHWDSAFACPDARINQDHRTLFKLLDQIATHRRKTDREDLELLLRRLLECTLHHFAHEETLMRASGYPGFLAHQKQHRCIANTIREVLGQIARSLLVSPLDLERIKEAYTFHFKRDDLPFMTAPPTNSVTMEIAPGKRRQSNAEAGKAVPTGRPHSPESQGPSLVSPGVA